MTSSRSGRHVLLHGLTMILVGLVGGLVVPHTPFPRIAMSAHIQYEVNGMLFVVLGLVLLNVANSLGRRSLLVLVATAWLAWPMLISATGNAWWGTNQLLVIAAAEAGATGGAAWQEAFVKLAHIVAGLSLIVSWFLLLVGVARKGSQPGTQGG